MERAKDGFVEAVFGRNSGGLRLQQSLMEIDAFMGLDSNFRARQIGDHLQMMSPELPTPPPAGTSTLLVYPTVCYSNAASIRAASLITVTSGQERSGLNLQLRPVPMTRVSGTISAPTGSAAYVPVRLIPVDAESDDDAISTLADDNGRFTFLAVPSGDYTLHALDMPSQSGFLEQFTIADSAGVSIGNTPPDSSAPVAARPTLWASTSVSVGDAGVKDLDVALKNGFTISGQVEFEGSERPTPEQMTETAVYVRRADSDVERIQLNAAKLDKADRFTTVALPPGRYSLHVTNVPERWSLKSAAAGDRDISGLPIEIDSRNISNVVFRLTDRPSVLAGTVHGSEDPFRHGAAVVLFPTDSATWIQNNVVSGRIRKAAVGEDGRYEFRALLPGDYYVAAISENAADDWQDPALLQQLVSTAVHVQMGDGEKVSRDLRLQELR
jgi:hypothetical protein